MADQIEDGMEQRRAALDVPVLERFVPVQEEVPSSLKVVSFNIQRGQRLLNVLGALMNHPDLSNAHVLCLQEVDRFNIRTGGVDIARLLAREMGMNLVYGIEFYELNKRRGGGDHGNAILTRLPTDDVRIIPLPLGFDWSRSRTQPRLGRRMAIALDLVFGRQRVRVINAHLENQCLGRYRLAQVEAILSSERDRVLRGPTVLVGDMNTFFFKEPHHLTEMAAQYGFHDVMPPKPRGTWAKIFKLDWILARGLEVRGSGVSRDVRSSDHKPLWATFSMPTSQQP